MATTLQRRAAPRPKTPTARRHEVGRSWVLDVPFAMRGVASAEGAVWSTEHGVYAYRGARLPASLKPFAALPYSYERHIERLLNEEAPAAASRPEAEVVLRPHQRDAVEAIVRAARSKRKGFILADDVGLGKTYAAWAAACAMPSVKTVLIVCPLAVVAHWRRTLASYGDHGREVMILNYDRLGKLFELSPAARKKVKSKKGLAKMGSAPDFDLIVWDESHRCKNPTAARSKFAARLNNNAGFVLWLSATAGQNPLELSYLAPLLGDLTGARASDLKDFEQWCIAQDLGVSRGRFGQWVWRGDKADCEKVHTLLFSGGTPGGLRRRPEDIAGWPEINRILTPIALEPEHRALYEEVWSAFRREMSLAPSGRDPRGALAAVLRFRQKSSLLRVDGTVELVTELVDNGLQVAISVAFHESLEAIAAALARDKIACAVVDGRSGASAREAQRLQFQRGELGVCLFTVEEGISLHQGEHNEVPRAEVIHDLRWSAIQMAQIEGRCHRDGRFAPVYWTFAEDTIEARIASTVCQRLVAMKAMVGDDVETLREIEQLLKEV